MSHPHACDSSVSQLNQWGLNSRAIRPGDKAAGTPASFPGSPSPPMPSRLPQISPQGFGAGPDREPCLEFQAWIPQENQKVGEDPFPPAPIQLQGRIHLLMSSLTCVAHEPGASELLSPPRHPLPQAPDLHCVRQNSFPNLWFLTGFSPLPLHSQILTGRQGSLPRGPELCPRERPTEVRPVTFLGKSQGRTLKHRMGRVLVHAQVERRNWVRVFSWFQGQGTHS